MENTAPAAALPAVDINLAEYKHEREQEWRYGVNRGLWTGGYPVVAQPADKASEPVVEIDRLSLTRDDLPRFVAWLTAVYGATARTILVRTCGHEVDMTGRDDLPAVGEEVSCWSSCDRLGALVRKVARYEVR